MGINTKNDQHGISCHLFSQQDFLYIEQKAPRRIFMVSTALKAFLA